MMTVFGTPEQQMKAVFQHHFARMWKERNEPGNIGKFARNAIRDNIRGQRTINAKIRAQRGNQQD